MAKKDVSMRRKREVYEEQLAMMIAILIEQKTKFLVGERTGSGTSIDPYIRIVEYYGDDSDEKKIDLYMKKLISNRES